MGLQAAIRQRPAVLTVAAGGPESGFRLVSPGGGRSGRDAGDQSFDQAWVSTLRRICSISSKCSWVQMSGGDNWMRSYCNAPLRVNSYHKILMMRLLRHC